MILAPQQETGRWQAFALTALMHLLLLIVLFYGVQWKRNAPTVVEAELWASRPQPERSATPPPPPPPVPETKPEPKPAPKPELKPLPPPVKPDIALKEEKKPPPKKAEPPPKPEVKKPEPAPVQKPSPNDWKAAMEREEINKRIDAEKSQLAKAAADRAAASWGDKIRDKIRGNIVSPPGLQGNPTSEFVVRQLVTGEIIDVKLKRSSLVPGWDAATERAIWKSSPLPKPDNPNAYQRELKLNLCPDQERGCR